MADTPGFDYGTILRASPVVLGMTEDSPEGVFSRLFDALVPDKQLQALYEQIGREYFEILRGKGAES